MVVPSAAIVTRPARPSATVPVTRIELTVADGRAGRELPLGQVKKESGPVLAGMAIDKDNPADRHGG